MVNFSARANYYEITYLNDTLVALFSVSRELGLKISRQPSKPGLNLLTRGRLSFTVSGDLFSEPGELGLRGPHLGWPRETWTEVCRVVAEEKRRPIT